MPRAASIVLAFVVIACGGERGAPRVRPLPAADPFPPVFAGPRSPRVASYQIEAQLEPDTHVVTATQTLAWRNLGATPVQTLPFHMYLNAFKNDASLFMRTSLGAMRGAQQSTWGYIDVSSVKVGDIELVSAWKPAAEHLPDTSVYWLTLPAPVEPGAEIRVTMTFTAQLPEVFARTGHAGEFHLVAQWFPKIGVRTGSVGAETWACDPFHAFDEFFADFGTYDVSITVPSTYVVAATGVLASATEAPGGTRTFRYRAEDVHDFAWMADPYMEVREAPVALPTGNTVLVRVYARPEQAHFAARHLEGATGAIDRFSANFVPYPWPVLTVIDPPMAAQSGAGGMEYPMFVTTAGDAVWARPGIRIPEYVTVHEVGHNWFQGMLASNEPREPWLDEGINSWADAKVLAEMYGARGNLVDWMGWEADATALTAAGTAEASLYPNAIATPSSKFVDFGAYGEVVYAGTHRALSTLENIVGPAKFAAAMKAYAREWAFKHPTGADFVATLSRELGQDLAWYFGPAFEQIGGLQLAVRDAACMRAHAPRGVFDDASGRTIVTSLQAPDTGTYRCHVTLTNTGPVRVPVDVELRFADGTNQRLRWDPAEESPPAPSAKTFAVERSSPLTEVWVDPDGKLVLANPVALRYRLVPDGAAAIRAGAWASSVVHTLMQVMGP